MKIDRSEIVSDLLSFVQKGSGVIIGKPGVGKSYLLLEINRNLKGLKIPRLILPIDQLGDGEENTLRKELSFDGDFITWLREVQRHFDKSPGVLLFDAFDAARNEVTRNRFLHTIKRAARELKGLWNVIVSVRTYDAKKSVDLLDLFGPPIDSDPLRHMVDDISCRHFLIPPLNETEIKQVYKQISHFATIYENGSSDFKKLLMVPFNIWLIEKILQDSRKPPDFSQIGSEIQLLGLFWYRRIKSKKNRDDREIILTKVSRNMVAEKSLAIRKEDVYEPSFRDPWTELLSDEILLELPSTGQRIAYSHNILFDYAVSILLIEDDPEKVTHFILEDHSRPLFLRPSLTYYFTRNWYDNPDLFWKSFQQILPSEDLHLRLFARLLPTSVIANESRNIEELQPLLNELTQKTPFAKEATLRLLQALRALQIDRDYLWANFLERISKFLDRKFAWDLAVLTSNILDRAEGETERSTIDICGQISRQLLKWIWEERNGKKDSWLDGMGGSWGVPLVAATFSTDIKESRKLLEKVLDLTKEKDFPIQFLYRLTDKLDRIWPQDPEFTSEIYRSVFSYYETSEDQTHMGGIVLPLMSTRRQDYDMCHYNLVRHYPAFLKGKPLAASQTAIEILNIYIIGRHVAGYLKEGKKLEDLNENFQFRGKTANYLEDGSCIWDEMQYPDKPIQMAEDLFHFLSELAQTNEKLDLLDQLLDIFRDHVFVAFFWKRLLETAAKAPEVFASHLFELCTSRTIQSGIDTIHSLGIFLEAAVSKFTAEQIEEIEKSIINIPTGEKDLKRIISLEHLRNRLLARIPNHLLKIEEAKKIRSQMEKDGEVPPNRPLATFTSWSGAYTTEMWLEEKGVNVALPENKELLNSSEALSKFSNDWANKIPTEDVIRTILPKARSVYIKLKECTTADEHVLETAWTRLGSCAETMSKGIKTSESDAFHFACKVLVFCASHESPKPDPKYDSKYESPHWSPAPRNEAAQGLPRLAVWKADPQILEAIRKLVHDEVPSVRYLVTRELFCLQRNAKDTFWELANDIANNETNKVVQNALCFSLGRVVGTEEKRSTEVLEILFEKLISSNDTKLSEPLVSLIMWLLLVKNNEWASKKSDVLLQEPINLSELLRKATFEALKSITTSSFDSEDQKEIAERSLDWLKCAIASAVDGIGILIKTLKEEENEDAKTKLKNVYGVIDEIVTRLYFSSQLSEEEAKKQKNFDFERLLRNYYFKIKPLLEQIIAFAIDKGKGVLFPSTAHDFMELLNNVIKYDPRGVLHLAAGVAESSERTNYNLDSIAIREVVKLVEAILADYRVEVRDGQSLQDLLNLLDIFAKAGWPEAVQLVFRLDEVFR